MTTGWINPPKSVHTIEDELPQHHDEAGLVWESRDGTVWETTFETQWTGKNSRRVVSWKQCRPERAEILRQRFAEAVDRG
jgi:hypothetical protein